MLQFFEPVDYDDQLRRPTVALQKEEAGPIGREGVHLRPSTDSVRRRGKHPAPRADRESSRSVQLSPHQHGGGSAVIEGAPVRRPARLGPAICRDLPPSTGAWERPHVDLAASSFVRHVRQPAAVGRKSRRRLVKLTRQEWMGRGVHAWTDVVNVPPGAAAWSVPVNQNAAVARPLCLLERAPRDEKRFRRATAVPRYRQEPPPPAPIGYERDALAIRIPRRPVVQRTLGGQP